jgi:single-strand DNA-binding protein
MSNINSVTLTGHLTHDPILRTLESGTKACSMRIAVDGRRPTADGWVETVDYFSVAVFGVQGEICDRYLAKGRAIAVEGRLNSRAVGRGEDRREYVKVLADHVEFLGNKPADGETVARQGADAPSEATGREEAPVAA